MANNVVLVTVDSLRADFVGHLSQRDAMPNVDSLAERGTVCERAYANGIPTYFAFRSILGGRRDVAGSAPIGLPSTWRTVADVFAESGYETAAFNAANPWLTTDFNYDSGFETFVDYLDHEDEDGLSGRLVDYMKSVQNYVPDGPLRDNLGRAARTYCCLTDSYPIEQASAVTDRALDWLRRRDGDQPFFLWVHYMDPHYPWTPQSTDVSDLDVAKTWHEVAHVYNDSDAEPDPETVDNARDLYLEEVRRVDADIGRLLEGVSGAASEDETVVCFTSDHGTELGDRGGFSHGPVSLYEETVRVPLVFAGPGVDRTTVSEAVQHSDIPRTLVHFADVEAAGGVVEVDRGWAGRPLYSERLDEALIQVRYDYNPADGLGTDAGVLCAVVDYPWKLHWNQETGEVELYDLDEDPGETTDRSGSDPETRARLEDVVRRKQRTVGREHRTADEILDVRSRVTRVDLP